MDYNNPEHKEMMDMEGLKQWVKGRTSGYAQLEEVSKLQMGAGHQEKSNAFSY